MDRRVQFLLLWKLVIQHNTGMWNPCQLAVQIAHCSFCFAGVNLDSQHVGTCTTEALFGWNYKPAEKHS
jgi:hypothetical protein